MKEIKEEVIRAYRAAMDKMISLLSQAEDINRVPFGGSWTAAQVAGHIYKSQKNFVKMLAGERQPALRDPMAQKAAITSVFLDMQTKRISPDFILPEAGPYDKVELLQRLTDKKREIEKALEENDLAPIVLSYNLPGYEHFSGLEWAWFMGCHTERHNRQLENIIKS